MMESKSDPDNVGANSDDGRKLLRIVMSEEVWRSQTPEDLRFLEWMYGEGGRKVVFVVRNPGGADQQMIFATPDGITT